MNEPSDFQRVLQRAREGDREAIGRIYELYLPHLERVTRYRLRQFGLDRHTTAADIHNSVFRHLLKPGAFDRIQSSRHLRNFLARACRNKATDILCKLISSPQDPRATAADHALQSCCAAEFPDELEAAEELARIYAQLTARERLLCALRRGGWDWAEIAARLNTTPASAKQAFSRSFRRARRLLREPSSRASGQ